MRTIIIEDSIYKVSEKEYAKLSKMEKDAQKAAAGSVDAYFDAEDILREHIDNNVNTYKFIGTVDFHWRH